MNQGEERKWVKLPLSSRFQVVGLTVTAIYAPYLLLLFREDSLQNIEALLKIWIIFPGFALAHLIPPYGFLNDFRGMPAWVPWTFLFMALCVFGTLRFRHRLWLPLAGVVLTSSALVYVMLLLLRA
jgi:hypothetical protein